MQGIVKQATDSRYWDLWSRQKLTSELELKRRNILKINQVITCYCNLLSIWFWDSKNWDFGKSSCPSSSRIWQISWLSWRGISIPLRLVNLVRMVAIMWTGELFKEDLGLQGIRNWNSWSFICSNICNHSCQIVWVLILTLLIHTCSPTMKGLWCSLESVCHDNFYRN